MIDARSYGIPALMVVRKGEIIFGTQKVGTMRQIKGTNRGQSIIEYAVVVALVSAAMIAMSTYVFRSVQATQKMVDEEFASR